MRVILEPEKYRTWLEARRGRAGQPPPVEMLQCCPVSTRMNTPKNDAPDAACARRASASQARVMHTAAVYERRPPVRYPSLAQGIDIQAAETLHVLLQIQHEYLPKVIFRVQSLDAANRG